MALVLSNGGRWAWSCFVQINCPAVVLPVRKCSCTARIRAAPKAPSPSPAVIQSPDLASTAALLFAVCCPDQLSPLAADLWIFISHLALQ